METRGKAARSKDALLASTDALSEVLLRLPPRELTSAAGTSRDFVRAAIAANDKAMDGVYAGVQRNRELKANQAAKDAAHRNVMLRLEAAVAAVDGVAQTFQGNPLDLDSAFTRQLAVYLLERMKAYPDVYVESRLVPAAQALLDARARFDEITRNVPMWLRHQTFLYTPESVVLAHQLDMANTNTFRDQKGALWEAHRNSIRAERNVEAADRLFRQHRRELRNRFLRVKRPEFLDATKAARSLALDIPPLPPRESVQRRYATISNLR